MRLRVNLRLRPIEELERQLGIITNIRIRTKILNEINHRKNSQITQHDFDRMEKAVMRRAERNAKKQIQLNKTNRL